MYGEDAPANATGTAVAGTGDDSSTVVMKKKKDKETMKDRLLRRFKIKETIDRTVPDLERPKDEIKEKVKHLKAMAMNEADLDEAIKGLQNKAKKTGMPYSILKQVYNRGMAAWKGGHRPGATQQEWAFARVNSFVTKSSGTWGKADKDLADKVRASKGQMSKTYKDFVKEYAMGLQVPATSYLKPIASLNPLRKKENVKKVREKWMKELKK